MARMATLGLIEYDKASAEVRAIYDDIMATRKTDWINNFWKALAHDPVTLRRTWHSVKEIMAPGALDAVSKEMIYLAVSATNSLRLLHRVAHRGGAQIRNDRCHAGRIDGRRRHGQRNQPARQRLSGRDRRAVQERLIFTAASPSWERLCAAPLPLSMDAGPA